MLKKKVMEPDKNKTLGSLTLNISLIKVLIDQRLSEVQLNQYF